MFLRSTRRWKDGKEHYYWSLVENRRCRGNRVVQHTVLYLGEINDSQKEQWIRAIEVFDEDRKAVDQLAKVGLGFILFRHSRHNLRNDAHGFARST